MKDLKKKLNEMMYAPTPMKAEVAEFAYRVICRAMNQNWLESVLKGHIGPDAKGSVFNGALASVWDCFTEAHWTLKSIDNGVAILRGWCPRVVGWLGALPLSTMPPAMPVKVLSLGDHPTLVPAPGTLTPDGVPWKECINGASDVFTLVVEYDGEEYLKDCEKLKWPDKEPILAACFPGEALPPSRPHDCAEGDVMTVEAALEKGWKVLKLEW